MKNIIIYKNTDFRVDGEKTTYSLQIGGNVLDETFGAEELAGLQGLIDKVLNEK
ncbi:MAG: hypothetical protein NC209_03810 [Alistipes sp.]|nr:hypothetical protein [Lachnospiraceae bacterium]MCM1250257.1 hypothetical protein [Alistipes sp.]MCM1301903.1 hypothetical protein [Bacteroides cellulosilyticus]